MTNDEKETDIRSRINPEEQTTVRVLDAQNLNARVAGGTDQLLALSIETHVPYMTQDISVPLSQVVLAGDCSYHTRDPERPLHQQRLMLVINEKRLPIIYSRGRERDPLRSWSEGK